MAMKGLRVVRPRGGREGGGKRGFLVGCSGPVPYGGLG